MVWCQYLVQDYRLFSWLKCTYMILPVTHTHAQRDMALQLNGAEFTRGKKRLLSSACFASTSAKMTDSSVARKRWHILGQSLLHKPASTKPNQASVRCFQSFELFTTTTRGDDNPCSEKEGFQWCTYSCPGLNDVKIHVRLLPTAWNLSELAGFNNTGNVCVWPSEEVLAYYCMRHSSDFEQKSICELGGGMTSLAGLTVALSSKANEVVLSDGNETSVDNIKSIIARNTTEFGETKVAAKCIEWTHALDHEYKEAFHYILCADCLFFKECMQDLINLLWLLLKPDGKAIIVAPSRSGSFEHFVKLLDARFDVNEISNYDADVIQRHKEAVKVVHCQCHLYGKMVCLKRLPLHN